MNLFKLASMVFDILFGNMPMPKQGNCPVCLDFSEDLHFGYGYAFAGDFCSRCCPGQFGEGCDHNCGAAPPPLPVVITKLKDVVCPSCKRNFFLDPSRPYQVESDKPEPRCFACWKKEFFSEG